MKSNSFQFSSSVVRYYFNADFSFLGEIADKRQSVIVTDENVFAKHKRKFKEWRTVIIPAGEERKVQATVDNIIQQVIDAGADRQTTLIGVGGGVVTDITGYVAGIYMRGIRHGFVPTSLLAMTDAAIGGKCGVDVGVYKNMVGLLKQPDFILYDYSFLKTLPQDGWINGFAEVIKHACIKDVAMFRQLEQHSWRTFQKDDTVLAHLVEENAVLKTKVVVADEFEKGDRKLLNFGHTVGHAIENLYHIPHGHAVSIGIGVACKISERITSFRDTARVINLLKQYGLPPQFDFDKEETFKVLMADKKKDGDKISYVVLDKIGKASVVSLSFSELKESA